MKCTDGLGLRKLSVAIIVRCPCQVGVHKSGDECKTMTKRKVTPQKKPDIYKQTNKKQNNKTIKDIPVDLS